MKKLIYLLLFFIVLLGGFLRFYQISTNPPGLYLDEVSNGLDAYSILTTGKDQYGKSYPFLFTSLGDYKVPGYIYIAAGSIALFGKNEFAIRFPSALTGTLTILAVFLLLREALSFKKETQKHKDVIALIAASVLAFTPWHIHFSRGGFEAVVGLFFYIVGLYIALLFWKKKKLWQIVFVSILFLGAMYTYDAYRIVIPFTATIGFFLGLMDKSKRRNVFIGGVILGICALPLFAASFTLAGQTRFLQTSAFSENPYPSGITKLLADIVIYIRNYLSYFSVTYLFRFGDQINRHQVNDLGILYIWQIPFILAGLYYLTKIKNNVVSIIIAIIMFVGVAAASVARPSPHTLRFLMGSVSYAILTGLGIYQMVIQKNKWIKAAVVVIGIFAVIELGYYLNYYYVNYPKEALLDWGSACKQTALAMQEKSSIYQHFVIDKNLNCIPQYFSFYVPNIHPIFVTASWTQPSTWKRGSILYIRPFYGNTKPDNLLETIYLPNINHDVFAQFFVL